MQTLKIAKITLQAKKEVHQSHQKHQLAKTKGTIMCFHCAVWAHEV